MDSNSNPGSNVPNDLFLTNVSSLTRSPSYAAKKLKRRLTSGRVPAAAVVARTEITKDISSATSSTSHLQTGSSTTLATTTTGRTSIPVGKGEEISYPRPMSVFRDDSGEAVEEVQSSMPGLQAKKGRVCSIASLSADDGDLWGDFDGTYDALISSEDAVNSSQDAVNPFKDAVKSSPHAVNFSQDAIKSSQDLTIADFVGARSHWMTATEHHHQQQEQRQNTTAVISSEADAVNSTTSTPSSNFNPSSSSTTTIFYDAPSRQSPRNSNSDSDSNDEISSPHHSMQSYSSSDYSSPQNKRETLAIDVKYKYPDLPMPRISTSVPGNVNGRGYEIEVSHFSAETSLNSDLLPAVSPIDADFDIETRLPASSAPSRRPAEDGGSKRKKKKMSRKEKKHAQAQARAQNLPLRAIEKLTLLQRLKRTFHLTPSPSASPRSSLHKDKSPSPPRPSYSHENLLELTETTSSFSMQRTASQLSAHNKALRKREKQEAKRLSREAREELKSSLQQQDRVRWEKGLSLSGKSIERISRERRANGVAVLQVGGATQEEEVAVEDRVTRSSTCVKGEGKLARTTTRAKRVFGVLKKKLRIASGGKDADEDVVGTRRPPLTEQGRQEERDHSLRDRHIKALEESRALARSKAMEGSRAVAENIAISGSKAHDFANLTKEENWI